MHWHHPVNNCESGSSNTSKAIDAEMKLLYNDQLVDQLNQRLLDLNKENWK